MRSRYPSADSSTTEFGLVVAGLGPACHGAGIAGAFRMCTIRPAYVAKDNPTIKPNALTNRMASSCFSPLEASCTQASSRSAFRPATEFSDDEELQRARCPAV